MDNKNRCYSVAELAKKVFSDDNPNKDLILVELKDMTMEQLSRRKKWANYIAMDKDGDVWLFSSIPTISRNEFWDTEAGNPQKLIEKPFWFNPEDWRKSLQSIRTSGQSPLKAMTK